MLKKCSSNLLIPAADASSSKPSENDSKPDISEDSMEASESLVSLQHKIMCDILDGISWCSYEGNFSK